MPLETATYTADLVTSNPAASDAVSTTDDHLRMIKGALKATFPNFSSAPLNSTQAQIDAAATAVANGITLLGSAHAYNSGSSGLNFVSANQMDLVVNGYTPMSLFGSDQHAVHFGPVTAPLFTGAGVVPIGGMLMWLSDTLPTVGSWCWANGGVLSRTGNGAALWALWGNTSPYGLGDNFTTFNVINMQEAVPVGKSTMGGGSSPGLLTSISSGLKGVLGGLFGADTTALTASLIPTLTSTQNSIAVNVTGNEGNIVQSNGGLQFATPGGSSVAAFGAIPNINLTPTAHGTINVSATSQGTGGTSPSHSNVQPSRAVNFIIRIG